MKQTTYLLFCEADYSFVVRTRAAPCPWVQVVAPVTARHQLLRHSKLGRHDPPAIQQTSAVTALQTTWHPATQQISAVAALQTTCHPVVQLTSAVTALETT